MAVSTVQPFSTVASLPGRNATLSITRKARWKVATSPNAQDAKIAQSCGISPVTAAILRVRGYTTAEEVRCFLEPDLCGLHDPMLLPDIKPAIARLHKAITEKEPILVYGDYDVDGVTSTAMLVRSLSALGANVSFRIPERKGEGYGLNVNAIDEAHRDGIRFVLTADCGIRDLAAAKRARELGVDLVITDHHEPGDELPDALAVINPKREGCEYAFNELSGCGVAFKVMQALMQEFWPRHAQSFWDRFVDLVGMAAIADCVPLVDENRILAREGLRRLASTQKHGLQALKRAAGIKDGLNSLRGGDVGFRLGPRLNAAGRLDSALKSLQLLLSSDAAECEALAQELETFNVERRDVERRILDEANIIVLREVDLENHRAIVVAGENWHGGVLGLVASRLAEKYSRPTLVLNMDGEFASGSGRSACGFNLHEVIEITRDIQIKGGGHEMACGLTIPREKFEEFRARVLGCAGERLTADDLVPVVEADCEVSGRDLDLQLARDLEKLEPCGTGNPEAKLMLRGARIVDGKTMGAKGEHVKWFIESDGQKFEAVWWRPGERAAGFSMGKTVDICFVPELNHWNGNTRLQLVIKEAKLK